MAKRGAIETATAHRAEEHGSHLRALHLSTLLQTRLKDEVHDMKVLTTYRAWLLRAVGEYQQRVEDQVANCSDAKGGLAKLGAAPSYAPVLLVVDTLAGLVRSNSTDAVHKGDDKWSGIAALGTKLFAAPLQAPVLLVVGLAYS